ncbi:hypothetical protein CPB83DRAFT_844347 [Crepidotus variabilis]|uniref:Uncharacterized protein n=1 Tax=Crepidotus variabilis TaxID=179855 RepID=A0A9P6ET29_9AGAR|nr:hypothetical protein CPB83DRAFT_844347 [Crepidotus variabilis]
MPNHPYAIAEAQEASTSSTNVSLKPLPITPPRVGSLRAKPPLSVKTHTTPVGSTRSKASPHVKQTSASSSDVSPRKDTDTVTVTLAQRLNELAIANSEGLLNDDEYRLLRQNLFERFSTNTDIPLETPVVPLTPAQPRPPKAGGTSDRPNSRPLSNFHVERPMSIMSKTSTASGMTGLFRRVTDRRSVSKDMSDTSSVWSGKSSGNSIFRMPKMLSKKSSDSSVNTTASRNQADTMSISSKRSHHGEGNGSLYPTTPRSAAGSIRRMAYAPSAFNAKVIAQEKERNAAIYDVFDEDHLSTVKDIQQEILNIEAEAKRLMDAFSGLEVTTLAKNQRHRARRVEYGGSHGHGGAGSGGRSTGAASESMWGDSDGKSQRRMILGDSDAVSMKSGVSIGTNAPSLAARSTYSFGSRRVKGTLPSPMAASPLTPSSLHRKGSIASASDRDKEERTGVKVRPLPPVPALPTGISNGHLKAASTSNISLINKSNSHLPMNTVPEDDKSMAASTVNTTNTVHGEEVEEAETDLEDIRRRREEVSHRYEARLEFLRAKLKGAQLHEKLMRK